MPRSKEEAEEMFAKITDEEREKVIAKMQKRNKDIEHAAEVASIYKHPGWKVIMEDILEIERGLTTANILEMRGDIFAKGAYVENLQGGMAVIETLKMQLNRYADLAGEKPADIEAIRTIIKDNQ